MLSAFSLDFIDFMGMLMAKDKDRNKRFRMIDPSQTTLLIVDDEPVTLKVFEKVFSDAGFKVFSAGSGVEAIDIAKRETISLALLDYGMPELNGLQTAERLNYLTEDHNYPFMMVTSIHDEEVIQEANALGALGFLIKPLDPQQFLAQVKIVLMLARSIKGLSQSVVRHRKTNIAVGIIMERYGLNSRDAYNRLRNHVRSNNLRLADVAVDVVDQFDNIADVISPRPRKK